MAQAGCPKAPYTRWTTVEEVACSDPRMHASAHQDEEVDCCQAECR